ncbi:hypothetical protein Kpol_1016p3a [Vanderwaltozyma polyspora DSM 70294]|uniref:YCII-related domain-containing protein n=1 Tax=Vanderwaltozyma polyspora (strain ATCC 22028 / DSM 70294 / BCRC 21397 / CBS 2163 / NBRC 10782 / NRRL Y-8283 / UCD 57-17) TaxID=436907 RepID=A7TNS2_VANPO|nr:uncharacterized protein Kpol_1016p3a [Vanderwaltozyma polyspora DSM 70294]EDO16065.1 hypothetical protein Kpol_1016p3a [Vanderwaltozyma polyspora DSM 70294]
MSEWCIIINDKKGSNRSELLSQHFAGISPLVEQGILTCGGAIYNDDGSVAGSHLQIVADTKEQALEVVKGDVFATGGIWDLDSIVIYKFACAVRQPK